MADPDARPRSFFVHLLGAVNVPRLPGFETRRLSPYVAVQVYLRGVLCGRRIVWAARHATRQPIWNSARDLALPRSLTYNDLEQEYRAA